MLTRRWVIVTDMDGTLLNHHDYRYDAILPELQKLRLEDVPVVLNSSKTRAELQYWVDQLQLPYPFVTENGSALFCPHGYFSMDMLDMFARQHGLGYSQRDSYDVLEPGCPIDSLRVFYDQQEVTAIDFSRCPVELAMEVTGLDHEQVLLAQQREYSMPLLFDSKAEETEFSAEARQAGFSVLKGGRFLHLLGQTDKGYSVRLLRQLYQLDTDAPPRLIVLGDSANDIAMLQEADVAVIVKNPAATPIELDHPGLIETVNTAPDGWVEGVESALALNIQEK